VDKKCFTLTEFFAMVIMGKPAGLFLPNRTKSSQFISANKFLRQIVTQLQYTKMRPVRRNIQHRVCLDAALKQQYFYKQDLSSNDFNRLATVNTARTLRDTTNPRYAKAAILRDSATFCADCVITSLTRMTDFCEGVICSGTGNIRVAKITSMRRVQVA
jgi:hypothetical protein